MGSRWYVNQLVENYPSELDRFTAYLNFDMEASPNYIRYIYDGETAPEPARAGSTILMREFENVFQQAALSFGKSAMGGGSDFLPFILAGVPASGLATGASGLKTNADVKTHSSGIANAPLDPCYHAPCDLVENVDRGCLQETANAAAAVTELLIGPPSEGVRAALREAAAARPKMAGCALQPRCLLLLAAACCADHEHVVALALFLSARFEQHADFSRQITTFRAHREAVLRELSSAKELVRASGCNSPAEDTSK